MRCAIYTRKSADEREESQYGSITAQRELCAAYVASQAGEGWRELDTRFDDEGWSGGTLHRPGLSHLIKAIEAGEVDIVAVYKIDRLSRSLRDFLLLVEHFQARSVTFVSITQSFSTNTSVGRLTLNVLLSFAQFERELMGERIRDWLAGARSKGLWTSGRAPFGYTVERLHLSVRDDQAEAVRLASKRYATLKNGEMVAAELNAKGFLNREGRPFRGYQVLSMLRNRLYRGDLSYRGEPLRGQHRAIITERTWQRVQSALKEMDGRRSSRVCPKVEGLLTGLLWNTEVGRFVHTYVKSRALTHRYYIASRMRYRSSAFRFRAQDVEHAVIEVIKPLIGGLPDDQLHRATAIRRLISRVDISRRYLRIHLITGGTIKVAHRGLVEKSGDGRAEDRADL